VCVLLSVCLSVCLSVTLVRTFVGVSSLVYQQVVRLGEMSSTETTDELSPALKLRTHNTYNTTYSQDDRIMHVRILSLHGLMSAIKTSQKTSLLQKDSIFHKVM